MKSLNLSNFRAARLTTFNTQGVAQMLSLALGATEMPRYIADRRAARHRPSLLALLKKELKLPEDFHESWDGLYDALCDDRWLGEEGAVTVLVHSDVFQKSSPHEWLEFYDVLKSAVDFWKVEERALWIFLDNRNEQ